jgi:hypothetical protein
VKERRWKPRYLLDSMFLTVDTFSVRFWLLALIILSVPFGLAGLLWQRGTSSDQSGPARVAEIAAAIGIVAATTLAMLLYLRSAFREYKRSEATGRHAQYEDEQ